MESPNSHDASQNREAPRAVSGFETSSQQLLSTRSLTFQSPPPDASEISEASSSEVSSKSSSDAPLPSSSQLSSGSSRARRGTGKRDWRLTQSDTLRPSSSAAKRLSTAHADSGSDDSDSILPVERRGPSNDAPLSSRVPSRAPSKQSNSSAVSYDMTNMHHHSYNAIAPRGAAARTDSFPSKAFFESAASHQRRLNELTVRQVQSSRSASASTVQHRAESTAVSMVHAFVNRAAHQQWEDEMHKRRVREEKHRLWVQHVENARKCRQPDIERKQESAQTHRLFNLKLRELKLSTNKSYAHPSFCRSPQRHPPASFRASSGGITFKDVESCVYDYASSIMSQQLDWIGQSGSTNRSTAAPMMTLQATAELNDVTQSGRTSEAALRRQEEGWFRQAQRQLHQ